MEYKIKGRGQSKICSSKKELYEYMRSFFYFPLIHIYFNRWWISTDGYKNFIDNDGNSYPHHNKKTMYFDTIEEASEAFNKYVNKNQIKKINF